MEGTKKCSNVLKILKRNIKLMYKAWEMTRSIKLKVGKTIRITY